MITVTFEMTNGMSSTNRLICQELLRRGFTVQVPYWFTPHFYVERGYGRSIHIFSSSPPALSFVSALTSNDKLATENILKKNTIHQLPSYLIAEEVTNEARQFTLEHAPIVAKPLDGAHGKGITTNVVSADQLQTAVDTARLVSKSNRVLIQKQMVGTALKDVRILVINGNYIGAIHRVPARVFGDGVSTVGELIRTENQRSERGEPYKNTLAFIDFEAAKTFLGESMEAVPAISEEKTVLGVANYGAGGELIDITESIPEWMKVEAIRVAEILELPVAGIDYMVDGPIKSEAKYENEKAVIIEVNKSPSLCIHDEPTVGENRHATKVYVDYLAKLD